MPEQNHASPSRLDRLVRKATWVMSFERLWPPVVLAAAVVAAFVTLAWLGVWVATPRVIRMSGVACAALGLLAAGWAAYRTVRVTRREALHRLDRDSGLPHRPVSTAEDELANQGSDPTTRALWVLHRKRLDAAVDRVRVAAPSPRMVDRDPYALRALAVLGLVAAAFVAGPHKEGLIAAALDWRGAGPPSGPGFRVDAWIDPPGYTGKPPIVLFGQDRGGQPQQAVTVPAHSTLVVRGSGPGSLDAEATGGARPEVAKTVPSPATADGSDRAAGAAPPAAAPPSAVAERRFTLTGDARLVLRHDGAPLDPVDIRVTPDLPPTIALVGKPRPTVRGGFTLSYKTSDDYGVSGADAAFSAPLLEGHPASGRSLVPPPKLTLELPPTPGGLGAGQTTADLSDHAWAGAEVTMVLSAHDEGGNVGTSEPVRLVLPTRPFTKPLARALVEQRQDLVFDPDHRDAIGTALDALMIAPDVFDTTSAVYLGLHTARQRLDAAKTDEDLVSLSDFLWQMALRIEDGDLSQAERDLKAAEQALREAMQRGASPEELKTLTEALRQQLDKFLAEMMQQNQKEQQQGAADPDSRIVSREDLQKMMQRMEDAAKSGDMAEAQRMLDQLQNILENLKTARNGSADQATRDINRQMSELDKMTRDQQGVRDKTFRKGQQAKRQKPGAEGKPPAGQPQGGTPQPGQNGDPAQGDDQGQDDQAGQDQAGPGGDDLQGQQRSLGQRLEALQKRMRDLGLKGEKGLDDAQQAMKDAEGALGEGQPGNHRAVDAQGRALDGLQKGAQGLAQQMAQGQSDQDGQGDGQQQGQGNGGNTGQSSQAGGDTDPLGRRRDGRSMDTRGAEIGEGVAARAQRVLQELRKRLGDPSRPQEEQDYLERLLKRY